MHPDGLSLIGPLALELLEGTDWGRGVTAIGGLTLGADPIRTRSATREPLQRRTRRRTAARVHGPKEAKTHGTGKLVEGPFKPGDRVAIIEDVITTGGRRGGRSRPFARRVVWSRAC